MGRSMGGLVATYLLKRLDGGRLVRSVVTLGTPHHGTPLAGAAVFLFGSVSRAVWQMLPGSDLVRELEWAPVPEGSQLVSIAGMADFVVPEPYTRLTPLAGHRNLRIHAASHWQLLISAPSLAVVREALNEARAQPHRYPEAA